MKKAIQKALKKPKEKKEEYKGSKVTPRHPQPDAQTVFQVPANVTPVPLRRRKKKAVGVKEEVARWDALAGSRAAMTTKKPSSCTCDIFRQAVELGMTLPSALPRATASSDNEAKAEASSEGDEAYWSEEDVRGAMLSRFDSSTVRMLDKRTLVVTGPDGKKDYFVKQKQMGVKSGTLEQADYKQMMKAALEN